MIYTLAFSAGAAVVALARPHPNEAYPDDFFSFLFPFSARRGCCCCCCWCCCCCRRRCAFAAVVLYNIIVSLCARAFFFSLPEAIKMMDDFPWGVPCRVVFFSSPPHSYSFAPTPWFSLSVPFHHDNGSGAGARDATGVCFSRERLNVKQETTAAMAEKSFVDGGGRNNTYIYIYTSSAGVQCTII